jgi:cystathionine beta-lyase
MSYDFDRPVDRRSTESSKWRKYPPDVLPLWVADMDFPAPAPVIRALHERVEHGVFGYLLEQPEFFEVVVDRLRKRYGWQVQPEAILLLPGVIPAFNVACRALAAPGEGVLLQVPVYPPILRLPGHAGLARDEAPLGREADGRYSVDLDRFAAAIAPHTRVFLLCNPHNPVGRVFRRDELEAMAEICLRRGLAICADEVHCDLVYGGHQHIPVAALDPAIAERTITLMAPSKTFNLAGLKCSVAIIPNGELRARFVAAQADLVRGVNILGYTAALVAYRDGQPWLDGLLRYLEASRDLVVRYVRDRLPGVATVAPEGTYLAWLDCRNADIPGGDPYTFFLERARVALNDGATFGPGGAGFVRLNFACPRAMLADALERLRGSLASVR